MVTLAWAFTHLWPNRSIDWLKVDAQGSDLAVVLGAGGFLDRIHSATLELHEDVRYEGELPCSHAVRLLAGRGLVAESPCAAYADLEKRGCIFAKIP